MNPIASITVDLNTPGPHAAPFPAEGEWAITNVVVHGASRALSADAGDLEVILSATGEVLATLPLAAFVSAGRYLNIPVAPHPSGNDAYNFASAANVPTVYNQAAGVAATVTVDLLGYRV